MQEAVSRTDYAFSGVRMRCLLTGRETGRSFCLFENSSPGDSGTPVHVHELEDETVFVLEGELQAVVDGKAAIVQKGEAVFMPRGVPHQLKNTSGSPSHYLIQCTPSGFEDFVAQAGSVMGRGEVAVPPSPSEIQLMKELAPRFGIRILPALP